MLIVILFGALPAAAAPVRTLVLDHLFYDVLNVPIANITGGNHYFAIETGSGALHEAYQLYYHWREGVVTTTLDAQGAGNGLFLPSATTHLGITDVLVTQKDDPAACGALRTYEDTIVKTTGVTSSEFLVGNQACTANVKHSQISIDQSATEVHACWTRDVNSEDAYCNQRLATFPIWGAGTIVQLGGPAGVQDHVVVVARSGTGHHYAIVYHDSTGASGDGVYLRVEDGAGVTTLLLSTANTFADFPDITEQGVNGIALAAAWHDGPQNNQHLNYADCVGTNTWCKDKMHWTITSDILGGTTDAGKARRPQVLRTSNGTVFVAYERAAQMANPDRVKLIPRCVGGSFDFAKAVLVSNSTAGWGAAELGLGASATWSTLRGDGVNDEVNVGYVQIGATGNFDGYWFKEAYSDFCP